MTSKYRARGFRDGDGLWWASQAEYRRWRELQVLEAAGAIGNLRRQVGYPLEVNGQKICRYVADFVYEQAGAEIVEDVKGFRTPEYKLKAALMKACYGVEIREVPGGR